MPYETVLLEIEGPIATITVNRPKALNALSPQVAEDLAAAIREVCGNADVKAVIVTGAGDKAFVAGADIGVMKEYGPLQARGFSRELQQVGCMLENLERPVIAAVNGFCLGGGLELAMCCDFIYCSEKAKFGQPEINLGIIPGMGGTQRLPRLVGKGWAKELCLTGIIISADQAFAIGLVNRVVPHDALLPEAKKTAALMASKGRVSLRAAKKAIDEGYDLPLERALALEAECFGTCFSSPDQAEGMTAFVEKRPPNFTGGLDE